jgi:hypothetical protein
VESGLLTCGKSGKEGSENETESGGYSLVEILEKGNRNGVGFEKKFNKINFRCRDSNPGLSGESRIS